VNGRVVQVESVPDAFAELVADVLSAPRNDPFSLFLSGGPTAERSYRRLAELSPGRRDLGWNGVNIYLGDERCVPPDHPDSNHRMIAETLLAAVGPVASDNPMYRTGTPAAAADEYQRTIAPLPTFDVIHLGLGPDGHTASLFPGSPDLAVDDPEVLVVATRDPNANNAHDRITLTLPAIARAGLVVFTVSGASKREAFRGMVEGADFPAARVTAERVVWLVDADAVGDTPLPA
jgi:6-phosphogluconolactonase